MRVALSLSVVVVLIKLAYAVVRIQAPGNLAIQYPSKIFKMTILMIRWGNQAQLCEFWEDSIWLFFGKEKI